MSAQNRAPDLTLIAETQAVADQDFCVVLEPLSHPDLGEIRIDESLFAIGRTEEPFASYRPQAVGELSRRHARIFSEGGGVYIADLGSKNGTTVNGVSVRDKPYRLRHGDKVCFGGELEYRVALVKRPAAPQDVARFVSLTLTPQRSDLGLLPIVITRFPFLVSKADEAFARYRDEYPHQVNYVSRRHAHIFLKKGLPFVEDLGSTNGTFVAGKRLEEHAVQLEEGISLAFGGDHFAYRVSLDSDVETHATQTKIGATGPGAPAEPALDPDRTTFVAAADSFLDIFCIDQPPAQEEQQRAAAPAPGTGDAGRVERARKARKRGKWRIMLAEARGALGGGERRSRWRKWGWAAALTGVVGGFAGGVYLWGAPEREVRNLLASGAFAEAAAAAHRHLARRPDDAALEALGTEALLKANVPEWLSLVQAREFARARAVLDEVERQASPGSDVRALLGELRWVADVEAFVAERGGVEAPIRIFADEARIKALVRRWQDDPRTHQRALVRVSSHVPEFKEQHARTLSTLRSLERDDSLYLAAIERLKASLDTELGRDGVEALEAVLAEYGEKYPRIEGLEALRRDLQQYGELEREMRARRLGPLIALSERVRFETPPFQDRFRRLSDDRLPSREVVEHYKAAAEAWRSGDAEETARRLERLAGGPWGDVVARELERKRRIVDGFRGLERLGRAKGYEERLLAFHGELDPTEDVYFVNATAAEVTAFRDKALERAGERLARARELWGQYQRNGAIGGEQRLESGISNNFRAQARLLSEAREAADQGMQIYRVLKAEDLARWSGLHQEINAEAQLQRRSLLELSRILEPGLLKAKLTLIGGEAGE